MELKLKSGFTFDYGNLVGDGKVTKEDVKELAGKIDEANKAIKVMREEGIIRGHLSKDGTPEKVYFSQLPYVEEGHLNSPASIKHLKELTASVKNRVDAVVSLGIGGSYLGDKVIFDVQCGEFWNSMTTEERGGMPKIYFSGNNIDPRRTGDLIKELERSARIAKSHLKRKLVVDLMVISKSGGT
ncbi:MAG TPA: glucose-6-phosphate isomerase, partial [Anaerovibrio sp.]|nr:glucose-6-phosphate isomerase [Anaerovibrio sp.]